MDRGAEVAKADEGIAGVGCNLCPMRPRGTTTSIKLAAGLAIVWSVLFVLVIRKMTVLAFDHYGGASPGSLSVLTKATMWLLSVPFSEFALLATIVIGFFVEYYARRDQSANQSGKLVFYLVYIATLTAVAILMLVILLSPLIAVRFRAWTNG